jgi:zinc-ribbon domain
VASTDTIFCPSCGERISARARFCPSCGARQEDYRIPPPEPAPEEVAAPAEPISPSGLWADGPDEPAMDERPPAPPRPHDVPPREPPAPARPDDVPPREPPAPRRPHDVPPREPPPRQRPHDVPPREPLTERIGRVDPQAGELSGILRERLTLPGMVAAGVAAVIAAGIVLAAGVVLAGITPENSILGVMGRDTGLIQEAFRQAVGTLLAPVVDTGPLLSGSRRLDPLILAAVPIGAVAFATRSQLARTEGAKPLVRLGWATVVAVPFALLMLIFAVIGGSTSTTRDRAERRQRVRARAAVGRRRRRPGRRPEAAAAWRGARGRVRRAGARRRARRAAPARRGGGRLHRARARRLARPGRQGRR